MCVYVCVVWNWGSRLAQAGSQDSCLCDPVHLVQCVGPQRHRAGDASRVQAARCSVKRAVMDQGGRRAEGMEKEVWQTLDEIHTGGLITMQCKGVGDWSGLTATLMSTTPG